MNPALIKLVNEAIQQHHLSAQQVGSAGNELLAFWMDYKCSVTRHQLKGVVDSLFGHYDDLGLEFVYAQALLAMFLIGCHAQGQPTIEELCDMKMLNQKVENIGTPVEIGQFVVYPSPDPFICPIVALSWRMLNIFEFGDFKLSVSDFKRVYLFSTREAPFEKLDPDKVRADLARVLEANGVSLLPTVDAVMHATFVHYWFSMKRNDIDALYKIGDRS
eukprot:CAMPEP_0116004848 /NCGR_PEP_ID=MMETSP0321-20121206/833_1 /TAXON_ID=163516 /ORGANISM="Leptocylindrus danicus var. danicus, Strain B650" /LENGTH=217 /DNA_ID=CAMNT_0003473201 /DNA_START=236 /DNA_END=889 /DNA_ORIENTATION=+